MKSRIATIIFITIFSILLWVFVSFSNDYSTTIKVPIAVTNVPEGYSVSGISNKSVTLGIKGEGWQVAQLSFGIDHELFIQADEDVKEHTVSLRNAVEQNSWLPTSLEINLIEPEFVTYSLEKSTRKKLKVVPDITLEFKPGYGLVSPVEISPDSIVVTGPRSLLRSLDSVKTTDFVISDLEKNADVLVPLQIIDNVEFEINQIGMSFDVQKIVDKTFENVPVKTIAVPPSRELSVYPGNVDITLRGGINFLGRLSNAALSAYVNYRQALEDTTGSIIPHVDFPENTSLVNVKPNKLEYIIKQY